MRMLNPSCGNLVIILLASFSSAVQALVRDSFYFDDLIDIGFDPRVIFKDSRLHRNKAAGVSSDLSLIWIDNIQSMNL